MLLKIDTNGFSINAPQECTIETEIHDQSIHLLFGNCIQYMLIDDIAYHLHQNLSEVNRKALIRTLESMK